MTLIEVVKFLRQNRYLLQYKSVYVLSDEFQKAMKTLSEVPTPRPGEVLRVGTQIIDWKLKFLAFIMDAQVPKLLPGGRGEMFQANSYHEGAMEAFKSMLTKEGIDYDLLVKATILYYKSGASFKKKISNFILDGDWLTAYRDLELAANSGEKQLKDHIKKELGNGEYSPYSY